MRDFLKKLHDTYDQIIDNQIGRLESGLSAGDFIDKYRSAVEFQNKLRRKTNNLLKKHLYPMLADIASITDSDEAELFETAQKLSSYSHRLDPGLAFKIYQKLLERARSKKDDARVIKYLYWCGITLFFFTYIRRDHELDTKTAAYFEEASAYADRYDTFEDPETRQYINRCLGNTSMMYYRIHNFKKAVETEEKNFAFWNTLMFRGKDSDFPWLSYFIYCLNHRHNALIKEIYDHINTASKAELRELLELSVTISKLYNRNRDLYESFGGARYDFLLWRAQFLSGLISFDHLLENIEKRAAQFDAGDYSADAIFARLETRHYLIFFLTHMHQLKDKKEKLLPGMLADSVSRLSSLPMSVSPQVAGDLLRNFAADLGPILNPAKQIELILKLTAHRHIQLYAHSTMVGGIAALLTRKLADKTPGLFVGCLGVSSASDASARVGELCDFAQTAGLCHDIGAVFYASNPFMNSRVLTDEEHELVRLHPKDGAELIARDDNSVLNKGYADVVMGHHRYYDNTAGFPEDFDTGGSDVKIMIDIVAIANSIDILTDNIALPGAEAKSVKEACSLIVSQAGHRYSPDVAALLKENSFVAEIDTILSTGRHDAYYSAYLNAWDIKEPNRED